MRLNNLLPHLLASVLTLLCSCHEDHYKGDDPADTSPNASYLEVVLDLGQISGSRAETCGGEESLVHGEDVEYQIHDACLVLFAGGTATNPDDAVFIGGATLTGVMPTETHPNDHISRRYRTTIKIDDFHADASTQYWAVIFANTSGCFTASRNSFYCVGINGDNKIKTVNDNYKYSDFKQLSVELPIGQHPHGYFKDSDGHLFMTNALLYNQAESALSPGATPLPVPVNVTGKFTPQPTNDENQWAVVYLERVAAKVNVLLKDGIKYDEYGFWFEHNYTKHFGTEEIAETYVSTRIRGWNLVNVNVNSYFLRHWDPQWLKLTSNGTANRMRFLGAASEESNASLYRVNYCQSYHYTETISNYLAMIGQYSSSGEGNWSKTFWGTPAPFWGSQWAYNDAHYCPENTMPAESMMVKNATMVNVCVNYGINPNDDGDFYIINGDKHNVYDLTAIKTFLANQVQTRYSVANSEIGLTTNFAPEMDCGGPRTITASGISETQLNELNSLYRIECYKGGNAFYLVPIAHFGDDLTPWHKSETPAPTPIEDNAIEDVTNINHSYPAENRNANYLGRWGVVRNNWYVLTINGIKAIGDSYDYRWYPEVIKVDNTPLDYYDSQLNVKIEVKPWTLREQSVTIVTP